MRKLINRWTAAILGGALAIGLASCMVADDPQAFPTPKPGPEFDILKKLEGTWDATMEVPGMPAANCTATYKMECGGLWLVSNFEGKFAGQPFQGKGLDSYNADKKKYVSVWVDSMLTTPYILEGTWDVEKKTLTMNGEMPEPGGKTVKSKTVSEWKDDDNFVFTMYAPNKEGKETAMFKITYKRKAAK
jgi:hypothetical protein